MRSVDALNRRLDNLEKRLPQPDFEFELIPWDAEIPDGDDVITIDLVGASRDLDDDRFEEDSVNNE
jgi:hypothetical protein